MKKNRKDLNQEKPVKEKLIKTRVRPDRSVEVELKSPTKSKFGKVMIVILVIGMSVFMLVGLVALMIEVFGNING